LNSTGNLAIPAIEVPLQVLRVEQSLIALLNRRGRCSNLLVNRNDFIASVLDTFDGKGVLLKGLVEERVLLVERDSVSSIRRAKH
jgi:hypothetical protein